MTKDSGVGNAALHATSNPFLLNKMFNPTTKDVILIYSPCNTVGMRETVKYIQTFDITGINLVYLAVARIMKWYIDKNCIDISS